jgi:hypothetical protein
MTAVKKKFSEDRIKAGVFETFRVTETPDELIIAESPNPVFSAAITLIFAVPMVIFSVWLAAFALQEGGAALVAAVLVVPLLTFLAAAIVVYSINTRWVRVTREAITITRRPISFGQQQIALNGLQGFEIVRYTSNKGSVWYRLNLIPAELCRGALFASQSVDAMNALQARLEAFLG